MSDVEAVLKDPTRRTSVGHVGSILLNLVDVVEVVFPGGRGETQIVFNVLSRVVNHPGLPQLGSHQPGHRVVGVVEVLKQSVHMTGLPQLTFHQPSHRVVLDILKQLVHMTGLPQLGSNQPGHE